MAAATAQRRTWRRPAKKQRQPRARPASPVNHGDRGGGTRLVGPRGADVGGRRVLRGRGEPDPVSVDVAARTPRVRLTFLATKVATVPSTPVIPLPAPGDECFCERAIGHLQFKRSSYPMSAAKLSGDVVRCCVAATNEKPPYERASPREHDSRLVGTRAE